jgi:hypothetical protein
MDHEQQGRGSFTELRLLAAGPVLNARAPFSSRRVRQNKLGQNNGETYHWINIVPCIWGPRLGEAGPTFEQPKWCSGLGVNAGVKMTGSAGFPLIM